MYSLGKCKEIKDTNIDISLNDITYFVNGKKEYRKTLVVDINHDKYPMSFVIYKDINDIMNIKKYSKLELSSSDFNEAYIRINNNFYDFIPSDIVINMFGNAIGITFNYRVSYDYVGFVDIEIELDKINKLLEE